MPCSRALRRAARLCAGLVLLAAAAGPAAAQQADAFQRGLDAYLDGDYAKALELWRPAAEGGDAVAAFNVGVLHAQGLGVEASPAEALKWYRRSASAGYANAQFNLGAAYYNGEGTETDAGQALSWWERAAEQDHPEALYNLGVLYRSGQLVARDIDRARRLFERAAAAGDGRAGEALEELAARSDTGAAGGQASAGGQRSSDNGAGDGAAREQAGDEPAWPFNVDPEHWTVQIFALSKREAAERFLREHDLAGQARIFEADVGGETWYKGVAGSYPEAAAARAAQRELEARLGASLWVRRYQAIQQEAVAAPGMPPDPAEPEPAHAPAGEEDEPPAAASERDIESLERAERAAAPDPATDPAGDPAAEAGSAPPQARAAPASSGDRRAALRAGQRAFNAQNYDKAYELWRPLAEQGVADAQYGIGFMYESGWGVEADDAAAFRWYQLAAQQDHVQSQFNLGMLYTKGQGVARNEALGLYWIQTAADGGDERAVEHLQNLQQ